MDERDPGQFSPLPPAPGETGSRDSLGSQENTADAVVKRNLAAESLRKNELLSTLISGSDIDPFVFRTRLSDEWLYPAEVSGKPLTQYETSPVLNEIQKRSTQEGATQHLIEAAIDMEQRMEVLRNEKDQQLGLGTEDGRKQADKIVKRINLFMGRLYGSEVVLSDGTKAKTRGLKDQINENLEKEELISGEAAEWKKIYWEVRGHLKGLELWEQRAPFMSSYDQYWERLFLFTGRAEIEMGELLGILEDKEYGIEIEEAMRAYVDIHLEEGVWIYSEDTSLGTEFKQAAQRYLAVGIFKNEDKRKRTIVTAEGPRDINEFRLPKPLQIVNNADIPAREVCTAYVKERAAKVRNANKPRYYVTERAELIAKRLMEVTLLSTWLSIPHDADGKAIREYGRFPKEGVGRLEGEGSNDLSKGLFCGKWENERKDKKGRKPAGSQPWEWEKVPFEGFVQDFFHHTKIELNGWEENGRRIPDNTVAVSAADSAEISLFDLWYKEKKPLASILKGEAVIAARPREVNQVGERRRITVVPKYKVYPFPENILDSWRFVNYKQSKCLNVALLGGEPRTKEDATALFLSERGLESLNKDLGTAFGNDIIRNWVKFNLWVTKLGDYYCPPGGADPLPNQSYEHNPSKMLSDKEKSEEWKKVIQKNDVESSYEKVVETGFLSEKLAKLGADRIFSRKFMLSFEEFMKYLSADNDTKNFVQKQISGGKLLRDVASSAYSVAKLYLSPETAEKVAKIIDNL